MKIRLANKEISTVAVFVSDRPFVIEGLLAAIRDRDRHTRLLYMHYGFDDCGYRDARMEICADTIERTRCLRSFMVLQGREARITGEELLHGLGVLARQDLARVDLDHAYQNIHFM